MTGRCRLRCVLLQSRYAAIARAWLLVGGAWLIGNNAQAVLLPPEGILLNRIHVQFEWTPVGGAVDYQLQVVEDDQSADPFASATPVVDVTVDATGPRTSITSGLQFGFDYAWRVRGIDGAPFAWGPTSRFATDDLPATMPIFSVTISGAMEPGLTMFNIFIPGDLGLAVAVDALGAPVWFIEPPERIGDLRLLANGRVLYLVGGGGGVALSRRRSGDRSRGRLRTTRTSGCTTTSSRCRAATTCRSPTSSRTC